MSEIATFAAGCFWGVEEAFRQIKGVKETEAGYTGGYKDHPTYREVCANGTGHAESVRITFNPKIVSYEELLEQFWKIHDPTQVNRQGADIGEQYRSAIFTHSDEQAEIALASKEKAAQSGLHAGPIATTIEPAGPWWRAEEYHQRYLQKRGSATCGIPR